MFGKGSKIAIKDDWVPLEDLVKLGFIEYKRNGDFMVKYGADGKISHMYQRAAEGPYKRKNTWYYRYIG